MVSYRSSNRGILAAHVLHRLGFTETVSLRTGLRGGSDHELPLLGEKICPLSPQAAD